MPKGASGHLYTGHAAMCGVARQSAAILIERFQSFLREETALCQSGVQRCAPVAFTENESISVRPVRLLWRNMQNSRVEHCHQVSHGKACADVRTTCGM